MWQERRKNKVLLYTNVYSYFWLFSISIIENGHYFFVIGHKPKMLGTKHLLIFNNAFCWIIFYLKSLSEKLLYLSDKVVEYEYKEALNENTQVKYLKLYLSTLLELNVLNYFPPLWTLSTFSLLSKYDHMIKHFGTRETSL